MATRQLKLATSFRKHAWKFENWFVLENGSNMLLKLTFHFQKRRLRQNITSSVAQIESQLFLEPHCWNQQLSSFKLLGLQKLLLLSTRCWALTMRTNKKQSKAERDLQAPRSPKFCFCFWCKLDITRNNNKIGARPIATQCFPTMAKADLRALTSQESSQCKRALFWQCRSATH